MKSLQLRAWCVFVAFCFCAAVTQAASRPPNIIIILADDLGYGDLGCYGSPNIDTPNLDRMAAEGMRFTDFYVCAPVCTPSRTGLITGRLPVRSGMAGKATTHHVLTAKSPGGLPTNEITIAAALKARNYTTMAIGKWHMGNKPEFMPIHHGFDHFYGLRWSNDMEPAPHIPKNASSSLNPDPSWWNDSLLRDETIIEQPTDLRTLTKKYTTEAVKFIKENKKKPFFLYFAHTYPHVPLFRSRDFEHVSARGLYGDVVAEVDWSVGQVLETLRKEKLADNTLVFFTSDNGPWLIKDLAGGSAGPLKDGKNSTWEGGMREPGIAWWPRKIKAGITTHALASTLDLFPTIMGLTGGTVPHDRVMDGFDMSPILFSKGDGNREVMFYYNGDELFAARKGPYKLHNITYAGYSSQPPKNQEKPLLFNVDTDPAERFDIASEHPDIVADIQKEIDKHKAGVVPGAPQY
jgi:arylsulfatase A-like enzyme